MEDGEILEENTRPEKRRRYLEVGENGGRKTTSAQRNENILLVHRRGRETLRDSIPIIGMMINRKRMDGKYQTNSRGFLRWCFTTES